MVDTSKTVDLPLRVRTPDAWADEALRDPLELLNDHAHLEKKAAQNALFLLNRWPDPCPPENWVQVMTAVARDEVDHLATVTKLIARRGGRLTKGHRNAYANALRDLIQLGKGNVELMDRLLVSALIEARSCERFEILGRRCDDPVLQKIYSELWASEHGHYLVFLDLARQVVPADIVDARWDEMLTLESEIIEAQTPGPRMHSWPAAAVTSRAPR
ncbi:MAG: tRNA-(ms[2]io[6]A)-hydroxylase [Phycisphaerales bacterium]|nr:tRNA-(ms[2]io[6]A)-hydroxylase [Phycisphaerales bacterium]